MAEKTYDEFGGLGSGLDDNVAHVAQHENVHPGRAILLLDEGELEAVGRHRDAVGADATPGRNRTTLPIEKQIAGIDLSEDEEAQIILYRHGIFSHYNSAHHLNRVGKLDPEIWEMFDARIRLTIKLGGDFETWWLDYKDNFTLPFQKYIDDIRRGT